ncbi:MAG TPA: ABC transporter permease [Prolixibacteraceae bacterium]
MIYKSIINTFRYLRRNGAFTAINITGLALGFACSILIIMHVFKENSYNKSLPDNERVFNLVEKSPESPLGNTTISYAISPILAAHFPEIEYFARTENFSSFSNCIVSYQESNSGKIVSFNEAAFYLADSTLFHILQFQFIEGVRENALKEPNSIVLSKETARKYFGNQPALGKALQLNSDQMFNVTGVVDIPVYVTFHFSMLVPITSLRSKSKLEGWDSNGQPFFKLHKAVNYQDFNAKIANFYSELKPESIRNPERLTLSFLPVTERKLYYNKNPLYMLIFIGLVILSVSILNYVNMSTSLVQKRTSEIALKKIAGAGNGFIRWHFLQETALICFLAILLGVSLSYLGAPLFKDLTGSDILPYLQENTRLFLTGSAILWLIVSLLAGFYPAIVLSGTTPLDLFKKGQKTTSGIHSKNILITFQFIVSITLVIITLMINRQYLFMRQMPLGFDNKMVMQIPFNSKLKANYTALKDELKAIPTVKDVCAASAMPAGIPNHSGVTWIDDQNVKHDESFGYAIVSDDYTQTFGMKMALGNEFSTDRQEELKGVIVNETGARMLGYGNPVGKQVLFWGKQSTIIGVVKDFQNNYLFNMVKPMIISAHPKNQDFTKHLFVSILPGDVSQTITFVEKVIRRISPGFPFEYSFTNAEVEQYIDEIKQINSAFQFASIVSILLAMIGLVALTYHATQSRIKEIGIRKVNGARSSEVIYMLNITFLRWIGVAFMIACPIAWTIIFNLLKGFGNKATIAWWIFALAGLLTLGIALLTVSWQSWKAATRNPVEALRYE